jgi:hypothetical protein
MKLHEDYCSFELSKLLKEKGFDGLVYTYYPKGVKDKYNISALADDHNKHGETSRPTLQMAMKWLREKDIDIIIMPLFKIKEGRIYCYEIHSDNTDVRVGQFETYKEAVEAAIKYSLENMI